METKDYWSRRKFAERCGVSHTYVNKLVKAGAIPLHDYGIPVPEALHSMFGILLKDESMTDALRRVAAAIRAIDGQVDRYDLAMELWYAREGLLDEIFGLLNEHFDEHAEKILQCKTKEELDEVMLNYEDEAYGPIYDRIEAGPYATGWKKPYWQR